jgi:hypothetical protein
LEGVDKGVERSCIKGRNCLHRLCLSSPAVKAMNYARARREWVGAIIAGLYILGNTYIIVSGSGQTTRAENIRSVYTDGDLIV